MAPTETSPVDVLDVDVPLVDELGATPIADGTRFGVWAPDAEAVRLVLVDADGAAVEMACQPGPGGTWWHQAAGVGPGQRYGFRVAGRWDPPRGRRANPAKLLLDPNARAITGSPRHDGPLRDHVEGRPELACGQDSLGSVPLSVVVGQVPRPRPVAAGTSGRDVVYETHVRGITRLHPQVPEPLRGTYSGLCSEPVLEHLLDLGVAAVELLPVHHFVDEPHLITRGLGNYWGYNTVGFRAPHAGYSSRGSTGGQVAEFAEMVDRLHAAGLEVLLDVVLNHTGEGDQTGPTLGFRGLANHRWYRLDDQARMVDTTGCGNAVNSSDPGVLAHLLSWLRYWVRDLGVDGFRFDLTTTLFRDAVHAVDLDHPLLRAIRTDPVLSRVRLVAEPWDLGHDGYQVGRLGAPWAEWNDRFRDGVRELWAVPGTGVAELATRLRGSTDRFDPVTRPVAASVNFVTAHDGFTARDLVSYQRKHNLANGEDDRDGSDDNRSVNHGVEGPSDDPVVDAARRRHVRNLLATLLLAAGTPMLTAGDELGRTQDGNNNAYCQDSEISWLDWSVPWPDVLAGTRALLRLRREEPLLRPVVRPHGDPVRDAAGRPLGRPDLAWLSGSPDLGAPGGVAVMDAGAWQQPGRALLGSYLAAADHALLCWFHPGQEEVTVALPGGAWGAGWEVVHDTSDGGALVDPAAASLQLPPSCVVVLRC